MSAPELLATLQARGVALSVNGERLAFDAPAGVLCEVDQLALKEHKPALIALLRLRMAADARRVVGAPGLVAVDRELSRLWQAAKAANPESVITLDGDIFPKVFTDCLPDESAHKACLCENCAPVAPERRRWPAAPRGHRWQGVAQETPAKVAA